MAIFGASVWFKKSKNKISKTIVFRKKRRNFSMKNFERDLKPASIVYTILGEHNI